MLHTRYVELHFALKDFQKQNSLHLKMHANATYFIVICMVYMRSQFYCLLSWFSIFKKGFVKLGLVL